MNNCRKISLRVAIALACIVGLGSMEASAQVELRIGVIDYPLGAIDAGARLAAKHINQSGGIIGADGTVFRLKVVDTPPDNMDIATANMKQASVVAVLGPDSNELVRRHVSKLQAIGAPVFTPATGVALSRSDNAGRIYRSRAADNIQFRGLADYLANALAIRSIQTVQLDSASATSLIAFANALSRFGLRPSNLTLDRDQLSLQQIATAVDRTAPDAVVIFGPPRLAARALVQIRNAGYAGEVVYNGAHMPDFAENVPADLLPGIISNSTWSHALGDLASREFVLAFAREFGRLPDAVAAASYDAVRLMAEATSQVESADRALAAMVDFAGVQGRLNPALLLPGEISANVVVTRLNEYGAANVVARYPESVEVAVSATQPAPRPSPVFATATLFPTATPSDYRLRVKSEFQNVRSGPGTDYDVIGQVIEGAQARILGATLDHSWLVIDYRGQWGWLAAYLVDTFGDRNSAPIIQPPATPTPAPTDTPRPPQEPDLIVLNAGPDRLTIGQATALSVTVANQGLSPASRFAVAGTFQPGSQYNSVILAGLGGGEQATLQLNPNLSGPSGRQSIVIVADLNNEVPEGAAGEANNQAFVFTYMADRPVLASGAWTTAAGSIDLDGDVNPDLSWTGNVLAALGNTAFTELNQFSALSETHYDAISATRTDNAIRSADQLAGRVFALRTADGRLGAFHVTDVQRNGPITLAYRIYR